MYIKQFLIRHAKNNSHVCQNRILQTSPAASAAACRERRRKKIDDDGERQISDDRIFLENAAEKEKQSHLDNARKKKTHEHNHYNHCYHIYILLKANRTNAYNLTYTERIECLRNRENKLVTMEIPTTATATNINAA